MDRLPTTQQSVNLLDILDRVLDKGLVVAGDVRISLANVELLTIRIRLLVCSVDKAEEIGLNWWKFDPHLTTASRPQIKHGGRAAHSERIPVERNGHARNGHARVSSARGPKRPRSQ